MIYTTFIKKIKNELKQNGFISKDIDTYLLEYLEVFFTNKNEKDFLEQLKFSKHNFITFIQNNHLSEDWIIKKSNIVKDFSSSNDNLKEKLYYLTSIFLGYKIWFLNIKDKELKEKSFEWATEKKYICIQFDNHIYFTNYKDIVLKEDWNPPFFLVYFDNEKLKNILSK